MKFHLPYFLFLVKGAQKCCATLFIFLIFLKLDSKVRFKLGLYLKKKGNVLIYKLHRSIYAEKSFQMKIICTFTNRKSITVPNIFECLFFYATQKKIFWRLTFIVWKKKLSVSSTRKTQEVKESMNTIYLIVVSKLVPNRWNNNVLWRRPRP